MTQNALHPHTDGQGPVLCIKNKTEMIFLQLDNILYIQADGNYCNIRLVDGGIINTLTYQRAEIARMMDEQLSLEERRRFAMLGRSFLINTAYVLRIQPGKHQLTFSVNRFGTTEKVTLRATTKALTNLIAEMETLKDNSACFDLINNERKKD